MTQSPQLKHYYEHRQRISESRKTRYKPRLYRCKSCKACFDDLRHVKSHESLLDHTVERVQ